MTNTAIALTIGGTLLVVGGTVAYFAFKEKRVADAPVVGASPANAPAVAEPAKSMSVADALVFLGGKALQEGIKYAAMGPTGYAASTAQRAQKAN